MAIKKGLSSFPYITTKSIYFFLVCDSAEPATDLDLSLYLSSRRISDAFFATGLDVCFLLFAILVFSFHCYLPSLLTELSMILTAKLEKMKNRT